MTIQTALASSGQPEEALDSLPTTELAARCARETRRFLERQPHDERPALILFRRAIASRDEAAWDFLYAQYSPLVLTWLNQHRGAAALLGPGGSGPLVNAAFAKFWQAVTPAKIANFGQLSALLKYLKMCVHSVVSDELRSQQARAMVEAPGGTEVEQEPAIDDAAASPAERIDAATFWQDIQAELNGEEERVLVSLVYVHGLKPGEVCAGYARLYPSVEDVYRVKRNLLERLRRNHRLRASYGR